MIMSINSPQTKNTPIAAAWCWKTQCETLTGVFLIILVFPDLPSSDKDRVRSNPCQRVRVETHRHHVDDDSPLHLGQVFFLRIMIETKIDMNKAKKTSDCTQFSQLKK